MGSAENFKVKLIKLKFKFPPSSAGRFPFASFVHPIAKWEGKYSTSLTFPFFSVVELNCILMHFFVAALRVSLLFFVLDLAGRSPSV